MFVRNFCAAYFCAMRIAVIHHAGDFSNDYEAYISSLLETAVENKSYSIKDYHQLQRDKEYPSGENILLHVTIYAEGTMALRRWYKVKLPRLFKKFSIDMAVCNYAIAAASRIPQLLVFPDSNLFEPQKK